MAVPRVSLILPVFNDEAHLSSLLPSLLAQSEPSLEILAVDDGSTDGSVELLRDVARRDSRLVVLAQGHRGVSAARNLALGRARGRWVAFADSDDWLDHRALQTWCDRADAANADLLIGNAFSFCGEPGVPTERTQGLLRYQPWGAVMPGAEWIKHAVAMREWPHYVWLQLTRRDLLSASSARFPECMANHSDIVWTLNLALSANRVTFCAAPLYGYRSNPDSLSRNPSVCAITNRARSYLVAMDRLLAKAAEQRDVALHQALTRHTVMEARNFLSLLRKRLPDRDAQRDLADEFLRRGLIRTMFGAARCCHDYLVAIRSWLFLRRCVARAGQPAARQRPA